MMKTNFRWLNLVLIVCMIMGLSALHPCNAKAADLTVGSFCTYSTISAAIDAASAGDRLLIEGGVTFAENLIINKNLTLQGGHAACGSASSDPTTINGGGSDKVVTIEAKSTVTLVNLYITNGNGIGGGVCALTSSQVTLDNVRIFGNTGTYGAGLYVSSTAEVTLTNGSNIDNNTATIAGGGARVWGILTSQDTKSDINDNSAPHGGGVSVKGGELHLIDADMSGNQATAADGRGGAILLEEGAIATMTGRVWIYNGNQAYDGAGIYADDSEIFLGKVTIGGNTASNGGGGIYLTNNSSLSASNATVGNDTLPYGNEAAMGAGIYASGSTVDFGGNIFNNIATIQGAGIYAEDSTINLTDVNVGGTDASQANQLGPGGHTGAGLYFANATQATLNNTVVSGNAFQTTGFAYGGGAYVSSGSLLTLTNSTIENHLAPSETDGRGAGIYINDSTVTVDNSQVVSNTAGQSGGGVRLWQTSTLNVLNDSVIADNHALNGHGGAIAAGDTPTINISDATLLDNSAATHGGAIYLDAGTLNVAYTRLHGNSAARGGAIFQTGTSASEVSNSLIYSNTATTGFGAGIRTEGGEFTLTHVTLADNFNGAGYSQSNTEGHAANSIAWGNDEGGFWITSGNLTGTCNIDQSGNVGSASNPRFVDAASGDFHLLGDSPAIDTCSTGLSPDLDNISRPFGDGYDMGAYEFYVEHAVEAVTNPEGAGTVSGTGTYISGSTVSVTASAEPGYVFSHWAVDNMVAACSASYSFPATDDVTLQANFSQEQSQYDITCSASPVNYGSVTGAGSYSHGADATVSASPDSGYAFVHWIETWDGFEGSCVVSTEEVYTFTAERDRNLTAIIRPKALPGVMMLLLD
ncbi:MAG: choice-of-anchor Q domain-containing protein [Desulfobacterales bacterium]|nr:choice-of-anchor Q domain-containing protein [Desulfobacterales bacterium]